MRCLDFALTKINSQKICSINPEVNEKSILILRKMRMHELLKFMHLLLSDNET